MNFVTYCVIWIKQLTIVASQLKHLLNMKKAMLVINVLASSSRIIIQPKSRSEGYDIFDYQLKARRPCYARECSGEHTIDILYVMALGQVIGKYSTYDV